MASANWMMAAIWACATAGFSWTARPSPAFAEEPGADPVKTHFIIDDANPESKVPTPQEALKAPLEMGYWVMLVAERAEAATKRGDLASAVKYYRAIAKAAPDTTAGYTRACATYEAMGDWAHAIEQCKAALGATGVTVEDHAHYVRLLLAKEGSLTASEIADADAVINHLRDERANEVLLEQLKCRISVRLEDPKRLSACSQALMRLAPLDPSSTLFSFALALMTQDFDRAERTIHEAKRKGLKPETVAVLEGRLQAELDRRPFYRKPRVLLGMAGGLLLVLMLGAALYRVRRKPGVAASSEGLRQADV